MKTFPIGGVHPSENKLSGAKPIEVLPLPDVVTIPLAQHIGAPAVAKVAKGDKVVTGQLIAEAGSFMSANIHAPVSGTVTAVDMVPNGQGLRQMMITIKREGDDWAEGIDRSETIVRECTLSAQEIVARIKDAGIVGMGGATFPTHVKLSIPPGKKAESLIINGVECEPYLTSDHRTMLEHGEELLVGVTILMKAIAVEKAYIGIENNKPDAIAHLRGARGAAPARTPDRRGRRGVQCLDDLCGLPGRAEAQAVDRARGDDHGQRRPGAQEPADPYGYARRGADRGGRRASRRCGQGHQRRPDDGARDGQPRLARDEGVLGHHRHERPRRPAPRGFAVHQVRQVRGCLPDGARTLLPLEDDPEERLGGSGGTDDHFVHRVRLPRTCRCWTGCAWGNRLSWALSAHVPRHRKSKWKNRKILWQTNLLLLPLRTCRLRSRRPGSCATS